MPDRTVQLSEDLYQSLRSEAERLGLTPEQVLKRLLELDLSAILDDGALLAPARDSRDELADGLAAVHRLTTLFADVVSPNLEVIVDDPLLALENAALPDARP
jgi:hypothetical protein